MENVKKYIEVNYADPELSVTTIAKSFYLNYQYLSKLFHCDTGMSIQTFLQRLRIEQACILLEQTSLPFADIALRVGYSDAKHFSRVFRRCKGLSPRDYRASIP